MNAIFNSVSMIWVDTDLSVAETLVKIGVKDFVEPPLRRRTTPVRNGLAQVARSLVTEALIIIIGYPPILNKSADHSARSSPKRRDWLSPDP